VANFTDTGISAEGWSVMVKTAVEVLLSMTASLTDI
jgi:hypothetical protein